MNIEIFFPLHHRAAEGHFPGNPIIPGALLLGEALHAIEMKLGASLSPKQIKAAKFFHPVHPGERADIELTDLGSGEVKFICAVNGKTVLIAQVKWRIDKIME